MSGRQGKRRRSHDRSGYSYNSRQHDHHPPRYVEPTAPRFGNRSSRTNGGDGGRGNHPYEAWEDYSNRGSGGGYSSRGGRNVTYDETYLNQVLGKLDQCHEADKCIRIARQLLEMLESSEQRVIQIVVRNSPAVLDTLQQCIERFSRTPVPVLEQCLGHFISCLGQESHSLFEWMFSRVHSEEINDVVRTSYLTGLQKALRLDGEKLTYVHSLLFVADNLQSVLEVADTPELLEVVIHNLLLISQTNPHSLSPHFKNTVDILVGWHIDTQQDENLIQFIADSLVSLQSFWVEDMVFSVDLLKQFLEDMDAYTNELAGGSEVSPDDQSTPEQCMNKLIALIRVFTTVLRSLGPNLSPARCSSVLPEDVKDIVTRIIHYVLASTDVVLSEDLMMTGNECISQLCRCLQTQFVSYSMDVAEYIMHQFDEQEFTTNEHALSMIKLVSLMVEEIQGSLPTQFLQQLLAPDSPFLLLRSSCGTAVVEAMMKLYRTLLSIRNIPLLENVYKLLMADMDNALIQLDKASDEPYYHTSSDPPINSIEVQATAIFNATVFSQVSKVSKPVIGVLWSPFPSTFSLLHEYLDRITPQIAAEFPAVHFAILYCLFQDCLSNGHYMESSTPSRTGSTSIISPSVASSSSPLSTIAITLQLLKKQMHNYILPVDICNLIQQWVSELTECLVTHRHLLSKMNLQPLMDSLTEELLSLTFSREHLVRLENASLLKNIFQHGLVSDRVIMKCVPECMMRLCDTRGEIRAAYSALLEAIPTHVITSFGTGVDMFQPPNGRKGLEGLRSCKGTWHARHLHMTKPSQVTFHGHHFRAIMGFIMNGLAPSKQLPDDWLERMFHSCQHRRPYTQESLDHPETHPLLMSQLVCNCEGLLWFWATYESAQYCLLARLKTPLGSPNDTFRAIETVLRGYAQEVEQQGSRNFRDTPSSFSGHSGAGLGPRHYTVHLRAILLLQFMEHLDKLMYNAYEGSCVTLPLVPKAVRGFFRKNMEVCLSWLANIRVYLVSIAIHAGMPAIALRHGFEALENPKTTAHTPEFWKILVQVIHAMLQLNSWEAIRGLGVWLKQLVGSTPLWITAAEAHAKGSFETACDEYIKALEMIPSATVDSDLLNAPVVEFIVNRVCECYSQLSDWKEAEEWHHRVTTMQDQRHYSNGGEAYSVHYDINKLQAMSAFDDGDVTMMRDSLEHHQPCPQWVRDPDVFPLWDPSQLLSVSQVLLLRAATIQVEMEEVEEEDGGLRDEYTTNIQRWLKLASAYAESPLRVGCLEWPLRVSPAHALQLQAAAAFRLLMPAKSRHVQPTLSSLLLHRPMIKSLNPSRHNSGTWNDALRYTTHLAETPATAHDDHIPSLLLGAYRLARKHNNLRLAESLIRRHIHTLVGGSQSSPELELASAIDGMRSSKRITASEKFHVMRELAKLYSCLGQTGQAVDSLAMSIVTLCHAQTETERKESSAKFYVPGNEATSRGLLTLIKWLQSDSRLLQSVWSPEFETGRKLKSLLDSEVECRSNRLGLYQMSDSNESSVLFEPDHSVARFERHEYPLGQLHHLATIHFPMLAKAWWQLAGWCYRIGRKNLEALSSSGTANLLHHEQKEVDIVLGDMVSPDERSAITKVLGQVHIADDSTDEDLKAGKEQLKHLDMEEDSKSVKRQLLTVCPSLERMGVLDNLLAIWHGVRVRMFMHYQLAARAYFTFLKLSGDQIGTSPGLDDMNVTATLRLLRLLVKYATELKSELESGFEITPTKPWKGIIPQLFSRLNHPEANVRQSVSDLLCRVGRDSPHYIIYPAIVGASKHLEKKDAFSGVLGNDRDNSDDDGDGGYDNPVQDHMSDQYSPPDAPLNAPVDPDDTEVSPVELSSIEKCLTIIVDSLTQRNPQMVKAVRDLVSELCRITLLWDEMWLAALMQRQGEVHRRLLQIEAESKRIHALPSQMLNPNDKDAIMRQKYIATMKPLLWVLDHLAAVTAQAPETPNERNFQSEYGETIKSAIMRLQNPSNYKNPHVVWEPFRQFQQMLMHRAQKRLQNALSLNEISPHLAAIRSSCISMPGHTQEDEPVLLESFCLDVSVLPTKTKPKKIAMIGSDGRKHTYLFKGLEDLHLDERIMQFMSIVNNMFTRAHKHQTQLYLARDYAVIPLGARSGLIQWVDNVTPLFGIYKRWQQREALAKAMQQAGSQPTAQMPVQVLKPNELFYSKIIPLLKEKGMSEQTPRKDWPHAVQYKVLTDLVKETPRDLLSKELWCASSCASEWWSVTQTYCRSTAVMCMIGYIIGLGDRHLDNLLVDFNTGQVVHVDYNVCFEKGKSLRVPERVPFRMTQNIAAALGFTGVDGLFRISCEDILRILRRGRETLLTLLEAFVYDPLIDWTQSEDAAFPLALRSSKELGVRQTRKEMEWEVSEGMLVNKLAESQSLWQRNRESLCSVLLALEKHLGEIAATGELLINFGDRVTKLEREQAILKEAVSTPSHPLITMQDRVTEQSRLSAELKKLQMVIHDKFEESHEWNVKYKEVSSVLHSHDRSQGLPKLAALIQEPLDLGPSGHEPAVDFLQSTGQAHTVESCDQLEDELIGLLRRRRMVMSAALDALGQYRSITSQFPTKYLEQSRSFLWENCLHSIINSSQEPTHDSLLKAVEVFEARLGPPPNTRLIMAVDNRLRKQTQDQHTRLQKLTERIKTLSTTDMKKLDVQVQDASNNLQKFCLDNPDTGPTALASFIILALCPLSRRWLYMEQTARAARERLSELTSREGDWFMDELCTMSGNVSQMTKLLEFCFSSMGRDVLDGSVMSTCITAVHAVHAVYSSMQDLVNKFTSLVMPEVTRCIVCEDPSFTEMLDSVESIKLTMFPDLHLSAALRKLHEQLHQYSIKNVPADLSTTSAVEEMKNKLSAIMVTSEEAGENPEMTAPLSQAQVILNGLNNLFDACEQCTLSMTEIVEDIDVTTEWRSVDLLKQTEEVMCTTVGVSLTEDLFFIRKAQAIVDFCSECRTLLKAFRLESTSHEDYSGLVSPPGTPSRRSPTLHIPTDNNLSSPIRHYISESLICQVLGQPSFSLTCLLVSSVVEYMGIVVSLHKPITIEEICKMANDQCQSTLSLSVVQHARSLFSYHDVAWRDWDKTRRLTTNLENCKQVISRIKNMTMRFQWLHEESLIVPEAPYPWVGQQRSVLLTTVKKVLSEQLATSITNVVEKIHSQQFRISQRLQWAAGANSSLNTTIDEFQRTCNTHKAMLEKEEALFGEVEEMAKAVIHLESSHTRIPAQTASDRETIQYLQRCAEVVVKLQLCTDQLSQLSDIRPHLELPTDGSPLNLNWIQSRLEQVSNERSKISTDKKMANTKLAKNKESVLSELDKLRSLNRQHRRLLVEVWQHLTTLAKLEEQPTPGQLKPGPRAFISHQNKFGEETRGFIQSTQDLIAADMSLTSRPSRTKTEEFKNLKGMASNIRSLAEWLLGQLLSFTEQLFQGQTLPKLKWNDPLPLDSFSSMCRSNLSVASQGQTSDPTEQQQSRVIKSSQGFMIDKQTGKALQQQNSYAVSVWRRVKAKLDGRDPDPGYRMNVSEQVKFIIEEATSPDNLCQLYEGWTPWV